MFVELKEKYKKWKQFKLDLRSKSRWKYFVIDLVETVLIALIFALLIRKYIIQTSLVPTGSMIPTLNIRDRLFVNKFIYRFSDPQRGHIVVFESPHQDGREYVKRCIGLPGDIIEIQQGRVYVNGKLLVIAGVIIQEDYSYSEPIPVPENSYFMLGDNRGNSQDSRYWGFVPRDAVLGEALFTFWPINRMRVLR